MPSHAPACKRALHAISRYAQMKQHIAGSFMFPPGTARKEEVDVAGAAPLRRAGERHA